MSIKAGLEVATARMHCRAYLPKCNFAELLIENCLVCTWSEEDCACAGEHFTLGLEEPLPCDHVRLQHALVDQQETDGFRHDNINVLRNFHLLHPATHNFDAILQAVFVDQQLCCLCRIAC